VSGLEDNPNSEKNTEKGEEEMVILVNPTRRDALKAAISELTAERGEGAFNDADIVDRAAQNIVDHTFGPPVVFAEEKQKYLETLILLREHPEKWEKTVLTFEEKKKMECGSTGKTPPEPLSSDDYTNH
jgi:hypothetical protein